MAYNPILPASYQQFYQPLYQHQAQSNLNQSPVWVQGEAGAKSYLVAPNNSVVLFDSESQTIYIKTADASGMPSMKVLDYTIRENGSNSPVQAPKVAPESYATKADIEALRGQIDSLRMRLGKLSKKEEKEDE